MGNVWLRRSMLGLVVLGLGISACNSSASTEKVQNAETNVCKSLDDLQTALTQWTSTTSSTTVKEFKEATKSVGEAINAVDQSAQNVANARVQNLDQSYENLANSVKSLPDDTPLSQVLPTLSPQITDVQNARNQAYSSVPCPSITPTP